MPPIGRSIWAIPEFNCLIAGEFRLGQGGLFVSDGPAPPYTWHVGRTPEASRAIYADGAPL